MEFDLPKKAKDCPLEEWFEMEDGTTEKTLQVLTKSMRLAGSSRELQDEERYDLVHCLGAMIQSIFNWQEAIKNDVYSRD